jgi:hypothetical protein
LRYYEDWVMCSNCEDEGVGRRDLLKRGAAGVVAFELGGVSWHGRAAEGAATTLSPGEALAALKSGNKRYVSHPELCSIDLAKQRRTVATHQAPWATMISCADSRVPPELIFAGHGVGDSPRRNGSPKVAQRLPHLAAACARSTEERASRLSILPRPGSRPSSDRV